ncbi:MAG TPA: sugar phosphate isomerase/epimerase [Puia sp.]|nr:sugar phosphate isomerase/epimerase [Puia sp.]
MKSRRSFLKETAFAGAGALILPGFMRIPERAPKLKKVGVQLYSVRKEMMADAIGTLKKLGQIGYQEIESAQSEKGNYYGLEPKEIKKILKDQGMTLRSGHTHIDNNWQKSIDEAAEAGQEYIICSVLPSPGQTVGNYQKSADMFNKAGEQCKKSGVLFGYHNHASEFDTGEGKALYDVLLDNTQPELVHMEMDLGWVIAAGKDPLTYFSKYPGRFPLWHLKDMSLTEKKSVEFGKGGVDIIGLMKQAKQAGMKYYFIEQEEYAVTAFDSLDYDYNWLSEHWKA